MGAAICSAWSCFLQRMALLFAVHGAVFVVYGTVFAVHRAVFAVHEAVFCSPWSCFFSVWSCVLLCMELSSCIVWISFESLRRSSLEGGEKSHAIAPAQE